MCKRAKKLPAYKRIMEYGKAIRLHDIELANKIAEEEEQIEEIQKYKEKAQQTFQDLFNLTMEEAKATEEIATACIKGLILLLVLFSLMIGYSLLDSLAAPL